MTSATTMTAAATATTATSDAARIIATTYYRPEVAESEPAFQEGASGPAVPDFGL